MCGPSRGLAALLFTIFFELNLLSSSLFNTPSTLRSLTIPLCQCTPEKYSVQSSLEFLGGVDVDSRISGVYSRYVQTDVVSATRSLAGVLSDGESSLWESCFWVT